MNFGAHSSVYNKCLGTVYPVYMHRTQITYLDINGPSSLTLRTFIICANWLPCLGLRTHQVTWLYKKVSFDLKNFESFTSPSNSFCFHQKLVFIAGMSSGTFNISRSYWWHGNSRTGWVWLRRDHWAGETGQRNMKSWETADRQVTKVIKTLPVCINSSALITILKMVKINAVLALQAEDPKGIMTSNSLGCEIVVSFKLQKKTYKISVDFFMSWSKILSCFPKHTSSDDSEVQILSILSVSQVVVVQALSLV